MGLVVPLPVGAEGGGAPAGFVVSPIYLNVSVNGDEQQPRYLVNLSNTTGTDQVFKLSTVDFGNLNKSAGVAFLGTSTSDFSKSHGLSAWMQLDSDTVTVPARKTVQVGVSIKNDAGLTSGGHYGAVLATAQTAPGGAALQPRVGVNEVLSSLILLIKEPGAITTLDLLTQTQNANLWKMPTSTTQLFRATGNAHIVPRGTVVVKDMLGREVERGALNVDSGIILPGATRSYETPLMGLVRAILPGSYSVVTTYRNDGSATTQVYSSSFVYLGWVGFMVLLLLVLVVSGWAAFVFRDRLPRRIQLRRKR